VDILVHSLDANNTTTMKTVIYTTFMREADLRLMPIEIRYLLIGKKNIETLRHARTTSAQP
jgi:hypothetical protein